MTATTKTADRCREGCEAGLFLSADGGHRCRACALYRGECNCPPRVKGRLLRTLGLIASNQGI